MSNIYDGYINGIPEIVSHDDRGIIVFNKKDILVGCINRIYKDDRNVTNFVFSLSIGTGSVYYFGIKPVEIIINNDSSKHMCVQADEFLISSIDIDRKLNRYIMTIEAKNEKYIRN